MTNNLTAADVVIVPREANDAMVNEALTRNFIDEMDDMVSLFDIIYSDSDCVPVVKSAIKAAISAAPPHNLIAVDKGEWERLREAAKASLDLLPQPLPDTAAKLEALVKACEAMLPYLDVFVERNKKRNGEEVFLASEGGHANAVGITLNQVRVLQATVKAAGGGKNECT